jgi:hypothetical protein
MFMGATANSSPLYTAEENQKATKANDATRVYELRRVLALMNCGI